MSRKTDVLPGLSIVMIGRNEEASLRQAIIPVQQVADEVVFVDTGSSDQTAELALSLGAKVFHFEWCDDFSAAKNFAIDQARYEWILNMDCDESLDLRQAHKTIPAALKDAPANAFQVRIDNIRDDGAVVPSWALRLFRNDPQIRYENPIHESIAESLYRAYPRLSPRKLDLRLLHWGYGQERVAEKGQRNWEILEKWLSSEPDHIYANYKAGQTMHSFGDHKRAACYLKRAFERLTNNSARNTYPFSAGLAKLYAQTLFANGETEEAEKILEISSYW